MAASGVTLEPWPLKARNYVQAQQERHYRNLAEQLGLGSDPQAAYARVSAEEMPRDYIDPRKLRHEYGAEPALSQEQWRHFERRVDAGWGRFTSVQPPTSYEDPNLYRLLVMIFDQIQSPLASQGRGLEPPPLLATLASGNVNAKICEEPNTGAPLIYFERGLFKFFHQFAILTAWCAPPIPVQYFDDDQALATMPTRYTMPLQASEFFLELFSSYTTNGTPTRIQDIAIPSHNILLAVVLLHLMESFMMAHELCHLRLGHLKHVYANRDGAWDQEFEADVEGVALMEAIRPEGQGWRAIDFWASDLALTALHFLDLTLMLLAYGTRVRWVSQTHPDYLARRKYVRDAVNAADTVPKLTRAAAQGLWSMTDSIFQRLWEIASSFLRMARLQKQRPSPMWNERIRTSFEKPDLATSGGV